MGSVELKMANIEAMFADPAGPVAAIIEEKTAEVKAVAKELLLIPGSGKYYAPGVMTFRRGSKVYSNFREGGRREGHTASVAGAPPAMDTGALFASVYSEMGEEGGTVAGYVGSDVFYILYLELGTKWAAPRPFLVPALYSVVH